MISGCAARIRGVTPRASVPSMHIARPHHLAGCPYLTQSPSHFSPTGELLVTYVFSKLDGTGKPPLCSIFHPLSLTTAVADSPSPSSHIGSHHPAARSSRVASVFLHTRRRRRAPVSRLLSPNFLRLYHT
jgi:hypothetical protein